MLCFLLFVLGSASITLQETTDGTYPTEGTDPTTYTTVQFALADDTFPTVAVPKFRIAGSSCKNQLLCPQQRKFPHSKGFPSVPSKNLVPPFTDSEEEELKTTEGPLTTLTVAETESVFPTTLLGTFTKSAEIVLKKRDNVVSRAEPSNEVKSYLAPKLTASPAQVDLSYLPPNGVLPAAAAANVDIARINYLDESPAAAQPGVSRAKPEAHHKDHRDICSDAFHSFLCVPLKSRKRITGALPNSLVPKEYIRTSLSQSASNAVQDAVSPSNTANRYLAPSTTTTTAAVPSFAPQSSNEDRSYLPPSPNVFPQPSNEDRSYLPPTPKFAASPSFNSFSVSNEVPKTTTRKTFSSTSTPRPFIQTSIIPFISPKVIEELVVTTQKTTTTQRPTTTRRPAPEVRLSPEPSNEVNSGYLPPATTKRPFVQKAAALSTFPQRPKPPTVQVIREPTKSPSSSPAPSDSNRNYIPPSPAADSAAAAQFRQAVAPVHHEHHDHHHHHGRDLCTDPFHSFLCAPLKQRKRITGALPPGFNPDSSNRKETRIRPEPPKREPKTANSIQSETRVRPLEETPAANAVVPQTVGYQYPKPSPSFPSPSQTSPSFVRPTTGGYQYPKPTIPFPSPSPSQQSVEVVPKENRPSPSVISTGYQYPKPTIPFPSPKPEENKVSVTIVSTGYEYPKPTIPFPLPSETQQQKLPSPTRPSTTSPRPLQPQPSSPTPGYQYPKPSQSFPPSTGYQYPKPANQLVLPSSGRNLDSADFIPVNKIEAKRQVHAEFHGASPRFGERLRAKVRQTVGPARKL